jgi:N-acetyl-beta-hexosaminidase
MKNLSEYAKQRGIDIIPEIDMPGHMSAAIRSYNDMSCAGNIGWGEEFSDPLCPSKENNYIVLKKIIDELSNVFKSEYFHIGADEISVDKWNECERCQKMMAEKKFTDVSQLKSYFVENISSFLKQKGKKVLVWDDAFNETLPNDIIYSFWRDWVKDNPGRITQSGAKMIFMDWTSFYLSADVSDNSVSTLYNYTINSRYLNVMETNLLGYQACVFTEHIPNEIKFEEHVYPSLQAFSEVAWGSKRNYSQFANRMKWHIDMMSNNNIRYTECSF